MYRIRDYKPTDGNQVGLLLRRLWSHDASQNERYLGWRYERNPYLKSKLAVAELDGKIAAVRGACGLKWQVGSGTELMPCLGDTVVAKEHEGKQLVQKLTRQLMSSLANDGVRYVVNQSPGKLVEKISLRTGWRKVGDRRLTRYQKPGEKVSDFQRLDANAAQGIVSSDGIVVQEGPPEGLVDLLAERRNTPPISHNIDSTYIDWRFNNPLCEYRWLCAYEKDELIGFLALARPAIPRAKPRCRILDVWGTDSSIQAKLLRFVLDRSELSDVLIWWNRFPLQVAQLLLDYGFKASAAEQRNPTMLVKCIGPVEKFVLNDVNLLDMRNWDARMIHSDIT